MTENPQGAAPRMGTPTRRVYDALERLLADTDTYPPRSKLPSYRQLCREHGVSDSVIRGAMKSLARQGRVCVRTHGIYVLGDGVGPGALPTYELIAQTVRSRIAAGTIQPGQPLVPDLMHEFVVGRHFVNAALRPLANEGLLVVRRGIGTYVPHPPPQPDLCTAPSAAPSPETEGR